VRILDDDVAEDGSAFLVMELLIGESLQARIARADGHRLPAWDALPIAERALDILAAAHDAGVVHRDIKPGNLFITAAREVKVLDFGLARARELTFQGSVTRTGMVMGTAAYMPPEQARAKWKQVDARSDLWAVGATIFRALTGQFVHEDGTPNERFIAAMTKPARSLATVLPDTPRSVVALVDRALAFKQDDRWLDARHMQEALRACYAEMGKQSIQPPTGRETAPTLPDGAVEPTVSLDDVAVSVIFEPSETHPHEITVEISDSTGRRDTFELQSPSSTAAVDDLLKKLPNKPPRP
jgi:serine/threonine protein kinase